MSAKAETWIVVPNHVHGVGGVGPWNIITDQGLRVATVGDGCSTAERARLVSAAPDMARSLVKVEWGHEGVWCSSCGGRRPRHSTDCELDAALRKAGLR